MTQRHGRTPSSTRTIKISSPEMSSYGETLHIRYRTSFFSVTKSDVYHIRSRHGLLRRISSLTVTSLGTTSSTTMFRWSVSVPTPEHAIGFLKGRFQSLKSLRINIRDQMSHRFATYWIASCIILHSFAMDAELEEHSDELSDDPFIAAGCVSDGNSTDDLHPVQVQHEETRNLSYARQHREDLKRRLFRAKGVGVDTSDSDSGTDSY